MKNLHSKNLNRKFNFSNSLTSVIAEFPTDNFVFVLSHLCKKRLNHLSLFFLFPSLFGKIQQLHASFNRKKKYVLIFWDLMNEQKTFFKIAVLQSIKLIVAITKTFEKYQWRSSILVKLLTYSLQLWNILIRFTLIWDNYFVG